MMKDFGPLRLVHSLAGKAGELIDRGDNTYGGKWVVNPSGGLISKGHPLGATGVAALQKERLTRRELCDVTC